MNNPETTYDHYITKAYLKMFGCKNNREFIKIAKKPHFILSQEDKLVKEICGELNGDTNLYIDEPEEIRNILLTFEPRLGKAIKYFNSLNDSKFNTDNYTKHKKVIIRFVTSLLISLPKRREGITNLFKVKWINQIKNSTLLTDREKRDRYICLKILLKDEYKKTEQNSNTHQWFRTIFLKNFNHWVSYIGNMKILIIRLKNSTESFITSDNPLCSVPYKNPNIFSLWLPLHPKVGIYLIPSNENNLPEDGLDTICDKNNNILKKYNVSSVKALVEIHNNYQKENCNQFILGNN